MTQELETIQKNLQQVQSEKSALIEELAQTRRELFSVLREPAGYVLLCVYPAFSLSVGRSIPTKVAFNMYCVCLVAISFME